MCSVNLQNKNRELKLSSLTGMALLLISMVINYFASSYASREASNSVADILLDNLPIVNVSFIFIEGAVIFFLLVIFLAFNRISRLPFVLKSMALFITIRAIFVTLTHIAPFPHHATIDAHYFNMFVFDGDLFFSGHAGMPYLFSLIFWQNKSLRYIFIALSIAGAVGVILGKIHYTIDVVAAYFITYTIFHLAQKLFLEDWHIFKESI